MLHYYLNIPKGNALDIETNKRVSIGMLQAAKQSFEPFEAYLKNIINVLERKGEIQARWKKLLVENRAQLSIIGSLYKISNNTTIKISQKEKGYYHIKLKNGNPDYDEKLICKIDGKPQPLKFSISAEDFKNKMLQLPIKAENFDRVTWGGEDVELKPAWFSFHTNEIIKGNHSKYAILFTNEDILTIEGKLPKDEKLFYNGNEISYSVIQNQSEVKPQGIAIREDIIYTEDSKAKITNFDRIKDKDIASFITDHELRFKNGDILDAEREGMSLLLKNNDYDKIVTANNIKFRIERLQKNDKESFRIQLIEMDDAGKDDDIQTLSPLRHFFDDDVSAEVDRNNQYSIIDGKESENTLILKKKGERFPCLPPNGSILKVKVNTYPLKKQHEAIATLKNMPAGDHSSLIRLFEDREKARWNSPNNESIDEWHIITDENRSGYLEQRDFVNKALNTQDFAILEGPPGSGKTTVILELICQLAKQNKRVLLCASTHVAIDNILERLKEKKIEDKNLLEYFSILPVRIGDENRIDEKIREFQIDNLQEDSGIPEELLLSAANLVCGTTIGILQHPEFKKRNDFDYKDDRGKDLKNAWVEPIIPEFDYLIIDESSKTTFQEFLVPALYAKKWILAGDVMQLSPFTERENIVSNLEHLIVDNKPFSQDLQFAIFYLQKLKDCVRYRGGNNRFVLPIPQKTTFNIFVELASGRINDFENKILLFVSEIKYKSENDRILIRNPKEINYLEMAAADIIFVEEDFLQNILQKIPESHAILRSDKWKETEHAFTHNAYQNKYTFSYREKGREYKNSFEIVDLVNNFFREKNWAEEAAWRIDREFQLRRIEKNKNKLTKNIEELLPKSIDKEKVETAINGIAEMAFPSILESLVQGIKGRKGKFKSTISEGFKDDDLSKRRTTLAYQHRMHSDISKFPREQFYKDTDALKDLENPKHIDVLREWSYNHNRYASRSVWVNVEGDTSRNNNRKEVEILMKHLKDFLHWAKDNRQPEGKKWEVACLSFYRGQEKLIREKLQVLCNKESGISNFEYASEINIRLHTVDKFQGHEADIVFLSMVQTKRVGFMDNPNRLNVAITRAKFQLLVFGKHDYFLNQSDSDDLKELARNMALDKGERL